MQEFGTFTTYGDLAKTYWQPKGRPRSWRRGWGQPITHYYPLPSRAWRRWRTWRI